MSEHLEVWEAILLGLVQGATEWLPVSSSGHLVFAKALLGVEVPVFFDLLVHVATLLVVMVYYRGVIRDMLVALATWPRDARTTGWRTTLMSHPDRRLALLIVLGTLPVAVLGVLFEDHVVALFDDVLVVAVLLVLTGFWLYGTRFIDASRPPRDLRVRDAVWVGLAQAAAVAPGISRSGMTLGAATYLGLDRTTAARYSFLLAVPTILGATLFQAREGAWRVARADWVAYGAGVVTAALVGYVTLAWLVRVTQAGRLHWFAPYCWVVGAAFIAYALA